MQKNKLIKTYSGNGFHKTCMEVEYEEKEKSRMIPTFLIWAPESLVYHLLRRSILELMMGEQVWGGYQEFHFEFVKFEMSLRYPILKSSIVCEYGVQKWGNILKSSKLK